MNKTYLLISLVFIVSVSIVGFILFNVFFSKQSTAPGGSVQRKILDKLNINSGPVEDKGETEAESPSRSFLDDIDNVTKARLAAGQDPTLVEKLRIYNLHDLTSNEFKETLDWVRNNAKESTQINLTNCKADPSIVKITSAEFTITNNDSAEINFVSSFASDGLVKIPPKESVTLNKSTSNSVLSFSCDHNSADGGKGAGFVYFE